MEALRTRRADSAPGVGQEEYFGRPSQSLLGDADLSDGAKVLLAVITLDMTMERTPAGSMASNARLAFLAGKPQGRDKGERWANRHLAELVKRGHVAVTQNRQIAGCPRVITPTAKLRGIRPREADCTPSTLTGKDSGPPDLHPVNFDGLHPVNFDGPPRHDCQCTPSTLTGPILYRENERMREQQQDAETGGVRPVVVLPADARGEEPRSLGDVLTDPEIFRGARKRLGANRQVPPEASRSTNPGSQKPTTSPIPPTTPEIKRGDDL